MSTCGAYSLIILTKRVVVAQLRAVFRKEIRMRPNGLNAPVVLCCIMLLVTLTVASSYSQDASCTFSVSPANIYFQLPGGTAEVYVKGSAPTCTFSAKSAYPWITVSVKQERGEGKVSVAVDGNTGLTHRVGSVIIDGEEVSIIQYGPRISGTGS
jgi:hypothetical protein